MNADGFKKCIETTRQNVHFIVIWLCLLIQMFTWGLAYRLLAYLNLIFVLAYVFKGMKQKVSLKKDNTINYLLSIPFALILIHFFSVENLIPIKEIRHIVLAVFLALGIWILSKKNHTFIKKNTFSFTMALVIIYVVVQVIAIWFLDKQYGTTKNPHYLALYSAIALMIAIYCFFRLATRMKLLIGVCVMLLGLIILNTSSRPAWIGLIFSGVLVLFFLKKSSRRLFSLLIALILIGLTLTNATNFAGRFEALFLNLSTEERVVIWQDAWKMQTHSSSREWLFGHGLDSFEENFKPFSTYHQHNIDFNSPHNFILELLYTSGMIGLLLSVIMLFIIYRCILVGINQNQYKNSYLVLLVVMTSNLILVSITLPFFSSYNLNIIAIVTGCHLCLREVSKREIT